MGRAMKNIDKLLAMPFGCGEQNMILFAPNIFILNYLRSTGQLTQEIQDRATRFLKSGESGAFTAGAALLSSETNGGGNKFLDTSGFQQDHIPFNISRLPEYKNNRSSVFLFCLIRCQ